MGRCDFSCGDVDLQKYFLEAVAHPERIVVAIVSEALPQQLRDYFDGPGTPAFLANTNAVFASLGYAYRTYGDYLESGIYLTTALKCGKKDYLVESLTIENCSHHLEKELSAFGNLKAVLLMGDFAIKAMNFVTKRKHGTRAIPAGATYKIRGQEYSVAGIRYFPSYTQTGPSFGLEKSKVAMIRDDVARALVHRKLIGF